MNSAQAQVIALVGHGNAYLHDAATRESMRLGAHSVFRHIAAVQFVRDRGIEAGFESVAGTVDEWLRYLQTAGTKRLSYIAFAWTRQDIPEHIAAGFGGAINVAVQTESPNGIDLWYPRWQHAPESMANPWSLEFRGVPITHSQVIPQADLSAVRSQLILILEKADRFARRKDVDQVPWAQWFKKALEKLDKGDAKMAVRDRLLPTIGYSPKAHNLIAAATQADVFGGAGSWNDLRFPEPKRQAEYDTLSANLYAAIKYARVMAANSCTPNSNA